MAELYIIEDTPGDGACLSRLALLCGFPTPVQCTLATAHALISAHADKPPGVVFSGDSAARYSGLVSLRRAGLSFTLPTLVHPGATLSFFAHLGRGVVIFSDAVVNPAVHIGHCVTIYHSAIIEHDDAIGSFVTIGAETALGGNVTVGALSTVGERVTVNQGIHVGRRCRISSDTAVISHVLDHHTVTGVPGRTCRSQ